MKCLKVLEKYVFFYHFQKFKLYFPEIRLFYYKRQKTFTVVEKFLYTVSHSNGERKRKAFTAKVHGVKPVIDEFQFFSLWLKTLNFCLLKFFLIRLIFH
jgi:hypothetical protein